MVEIFSSSCISMRCSFYLELGCIPMEVGPLEIELLVEVSCEKYSWTVSVSSNIGISLVSILKANSRHGSDQELQNVEPYGSSLLLPGWSCCAVDAPPVCVFLSSSFAATRSMDCGFFCLWKLPAAESSWGGWSKVVVAGFSCSWPKASGFALWDFLAALEFVIWMFLRAANRLDARSGFSIGLTDARSDFLIRLAAFEIVGCNLFALPRFVGWDCACFFDSDFAENGRFSFCCWREGEWSTFEFSPSKQLWYGELMLIPVSTAAAPATRRQKENKKTQSRQICSIKNPTCP